MISKQEALAFTARWKLVNERITSEIRSMPPDVKLRQLEVMYASAQALGWTERLASDETRVRELWIKLKSDPRLI
ncbi:MAG: hypothetical protein ACRD63_07965 [Pyrinomonadaceae bacterium]